jgi:hypothetical protein
MAAAVARLETDGGPGKADRHLGGQSAGQKPSGKTGQRQDREQDHEQGSQTNKILDRTARRMGQQGFDRVFHRSLPKCCRIVLTFGGDCKELFKNIREHSMT